MVTDFEQTDLAILAGKYLTFNLFEEHYGVSVNSIQQIIAIPTITPIPKTPDFIKGVINLRGKIIPVVDLRRKFNLQVQDYNDRTSIIVTKLTANDHELLIGVIVDKVLEVLDIDSHNIEETPKFGVKLDTEYLLGMAKVKNKVVSLININRILTEEKMYVAQSSLS